MDRASKIGHHSSLGHLSKTEPNWPEACIRWQKVIGWHYYIDGDIVHNYAKKSFWRYTAEYVLPKFGSVGYLASKPSQGANRVQTFKIFKPVTAATQCLLCWIYPAVFAI